MEGGRVAELPGTASAGIEGTEGLHLGANSGGRELRLRVAE